MAVKTYNLPSPVVNAKEHKALESLTVTYQKMIEPGVAQKAAQKVGEIIPASVKDLAHSTTQKVSETEIFIKSMELVGEAFNSLEQFAAKATLSEGYIVSHIDKECSNNTITSLDEICLARSYEVSRFVEKAQQADVLAAMVEGAVTGFPGFAGIPFNIVASTFLFYRAVQSVAMCYGYDVKNDPAELQIASEVFINAMNPKSATGSELSGTIAKIMLFTTGTTVKTTVKKGWEAMAARGGVTLLLTQMRALANGAAKKALEKAGKAGLEKAAFSEVFEQIGKKLTQKAIGKAIPYVGAFVGATIDTAQMIQILKYAKIFYSKRFILEKGSRITVLIAPEEQYCEVSEE